MSINDMENKARAYREILAAINALQEQADAIKAELIAEMDARQANAVTAGAFTIRYTAYESSRLCTSKLKEARLYDKYSSKHTVLRFSVQ